jgi:hypothetical protein
MTDFTAYSATTHPVVRLEDDYNNILDHGLEKGFSYIIRKNGANYEAINGATGKIDYTSAGATTTLQNCVNVLKGSLVTATRQRTNGIIKIMDDLIVTGSLDFTDIQGTTFEGFSREDGVVIHIQSNADVVFDFTSSRAIQFKNIEFEVDAGYTPKVVFLMARDSSGDSVGDFAFSHVQFNDQGGVQTAFIYNYGSELNLWYNCVFSCKGRAVVITDSNASSVTSEYTTIAIGTKSTSMNTFTGMTEFNCGNLITDEAILVYKGVSATLIDNCYAGGGTKYFIGFDLTGGSVYKTTVTNCHFEMLGLKATSDGNPSYLNSLSFTNNQILPVVGNFIDFSEANIFLRDSTINSLYNLGAADVDLAFYMIDQSDLNLRCDPYRFKITVSQYIRNSTLIIYNTAYVTTGGFVAVEKKYYGLITTSTGLATFTSGNTVATAAHGLSGTPTIVTIGAKYPEVTDAYWSADATHITFTIGSGPAGARDLAWYAEYKP